MLFADQSVTINLRYIDICYKFVLNILSTNCVVRSQIFLLYTTRLSKFEQRIIT